MNSNAEKSKILPEGWREVRLGAVISLRKEKFDPVNSCENMICIELEHLEKDTGRIVSSSFSSNKQSLKSVFSPGDILYGKLRPNLRKYAFPQFDGVCTTEIWVFKVDTDVCIPKFVFYLVQSSDFTKNACRTTGTKMPRADWGVLKKHPVKIPSFQAQKAIASLLETWDTAIEKTEALIAAKGKRFKWLLKTLISDQCDSLEWKDTKLADLCRIRKGEQLNKLQMIETGKYPALNGGITPSGYTDKWNTPANTVTISEGGNSCGYVNFNTHNFWAGGHCYTLTNLTDKLNVWFLYYQLKEKEQSIMKLRVGSGLPNIQKGDIEQFPFIMPPRSKQKQITSILNMAQREIDLLRRSSEEYRMQKRGLMQKLLIGEWRTT